MQFSTETLKTSVSRNSRMDNAHLLIAAVAELGHQAEPLFILQFLPGNSLGDIQKFLSDQAFEFAERLLLKNPAHFFLPGGIAFAQNQLATLFEEGPRELRHSFPQFLLALQSKRH